MSKTVGIDLGTTNSEVAILENGQPRMLSIDHEEFMLPSCVGFDAAGKVVIGREALRQYAAAPERTVKSIKRHMGTEHQTVLQVPGQEAQSFLPHEVSALVLKKLVQCAERELGEPVTKAVITVPAYFTDAQRQATKLAGELAGLEVLQIINEPTAAALTYGDRTDESEVVLVYDLGGGTFDVSLVEMTGDVTEVLASHGNNRLGGDDFDRRLQILLAQRFQETQNQPVPEDAVTQARLLQAAERAKMELSRHAFVTVREPYLMEEQGKALHLETEVSRQDFEELIRPLLTETLTAIDRALDDVKLQAADINRVLLVGGSTRIPLVQELLTEHLGQRPIDSVQPDLCVALGAAMQAGVLSGEAIDSILVDVCPHSLGVAVAMDTPQGEVEGMFSVIIPRNSTIPISRSEVYYTGHPRQKAVEIEVFQGENAVAAENVPLGTYQVDDLPPQVNRTLAVEINFDFDFNGILTVTTTAKDGGKQGILVLNNAEIQRMSSQELTAMRQRLTTMFTDQEEEGEAMESVALDPELSDLLERAKQVLSTLTDAEEKAELQNLLTKILTATTLGISVDPALQEELDDRLYYLTTGGEE